MHGHSLTDKRSPRLTPHFPSPHPLHSDASLAMVSHNVEALLASERQQLEAQQAQHAQQQRAVAEAAAAFTDAAAAVHEAQAAVHGVAAAWAADDLEEVAAEPTGPAVDGTPLAASAPAAAHSAPAAPAAPALERSAAAATPETAAPAAARSSVSEQLFHFGGSDEGPSALQLARQQLVGRLPEEAAAGLEAALRSMNGAPGSRKQRAALASLALHGPAVPAEQPSTPQPLPPAASARRRRQPAAPPAVPAAGSRGKAGAGVLQRVSHGKPRGSSGEWAMGYAQVLLGRRTTRGRECTLSRLRAKRPSLSAECACNAWLAAVAAAGEAGRHGQQVRCCSRPVCTPALHAMSRAHSVPVMQH